MKKIVDSTYYWKALAEAGLDVFDKTKVFEYMNKASDEGDDRATYSLATCYHFGAWGVVTDKKRAYHLLKSLENSNIAEAHFDLAVCYDSGKIVRRNQKLAFSFYVKAGLLGDKEACEQVAQFYATGEVVPKDKKLADAWMTRAECDEIKISPPYRRWLR